jgi:hypothetical protein
MSTVGEGYWDCINPECLEMTNTVEQDKVCWNCEKTEQPKDLEKNLEAYVKLAKE